MTALQPTRPPLLHHIYRFHCNGFREMTLGRTQRKIIFIKLFIMFAVFIFFFFPDFLAMNFTTDAERADHVIEQLTQSARGSNHPVKGESP